VGHASADAVGLAGVALGNMYCILTGLAPAYGMATAADTLASQAYGRDRASPLVGLVLQQCILILLVLAIPIAVLWANAAPILELCGQDPAVAALAGLYCRVLIAGLPPLMVFEALKKYTQAQGT
jgi:multidrug resistance protein, MATE family